MGDRFGHVIALAEGDARIELLRSVEGDHTHSWPPSPPLQEVHLEQRGDGASIALAVGKAGSSHWSLSVEPADWASVGRLSRAVSNTPTPLRPAPTGLESRPTTDSPATPVGRLSRAVRITPTSIHPAPTGLESRPTTELPPVALVFDVAVRIKTAAASLGSRYRLLGSARASDAASGANQAALAVNLPDFQSSGTRQLLIVGDTGGEASCGVETASTSEKDDATEIVIRPRLLPAPPGTARWRYCIALV